MTHPTDEELDALIELSEKFVTATWHLLDNSETSGPIDDPTITVWQPDFDEVSALLDRCEGLPSGSTEHMTAGELLSANLISAITALRAQLARREEMHECAMEERDDATIYADEQKARADRAEAMREAASPDQTTHLQARVKVLEDALRRLLTPFGDDACRLDHHGYCQEHFIEEDCCVAFARATLAASIPADPVTNAGCCQAVRVRPLEWRETNGGNCRKGEIYSARSLVNFAPIAAHKKHDGWWLNVDCKTYPTLEAAKAAAQADYEARIRSALTIAPAPDPAKVQALIEAAKDAKLILAEHEPYPLKVCQSVIAALRAIGEGEA